MNCYFCAADGTTTPAVGACAQCGSSICTDHGGLTAIPTFIKSSGGIGGPYVRAKRDQRRMLCSDCAEDAEASGAVSYIDEITL